VKTAVADVGRWDQKAIAIHVELLLMMDIAGMTGAVLTGALSVEHNGDRDDARVLHDSETYAPKDR